MWESDLRKVLEVLKEVSFYIFPFYNTIKSKWVKNKQCPFISVSPIKIVPPINQLKFD